MKSPYREVLREIEKEYWKDAYGTVYTDQRRHFTRYSLPRNFGHPGDFAEAFRETVRTRVEQELTLLGLPFEKVAFTQSWLAGTVPAEKYLRLGIFVKRAELVSVTLHFKKSEILKALGEAIKESGWTPVRNTEMEDSLVARLEEDLPTLVETYTHNETALEGLAAFYSGNELLLDYGLARRKND